MKSLFTVLLLLTFAPLSCCAQKHNPIVAQAHKTTHHILMETILNSGSCSATAIGPYALLTASHCEMPNDLITVDGEDRKVLRVMRDGYDHSIYLLDGGKAFVYFAQLGDSTTVEPGDEVFIFGNPGELVDMYRRGVVSAVHKNEARLSLDGWFGDSGSGVFDGEGKLIYVVSTVHVQDKDGITVKFMGVFALAFTQAQLSDAVNFDPLPTEMPKGETWEIQP